MHAIYKILSVIMALGVLTVSQSALATEGEPHWYVGVNYASFETTDVSTTKDDVGTNGALIKLGYDFNNWLGVEGFIARSTTSKPENGTTYKLNYLSYFGPRVTLRMENFVLYATAGGALIGDEACLNNVCTTKQGANVAAGFGFDMFGSDNIALNLSVMYYETEQASNSYSISAGISWYFDNPKVVPRY